MESEDQRHAPTSSRDHRPGRPAETEAAWDVVARVKYRAELEDHVAFLEAGRHSLLEPELAIVGPLLLGAHVVHLQCSHGLETLGLLNADAGSVTGLDFSAEMIEQAREKARRLGASADFHHADVTAPPEALHNAADVIYTGRGSLPWVADLDAWARTVRRILKRGGHLFLFEGHPLDALWVRDAEDLSLKPDASYFASEAAEQEGFPSSVLRRELGERDRPRMPERMWRPGEVIRALVRSGLVIVRYDEHPDLYWNQFPRWPDRLRTALPHSYSILASG